MQILTGQDLEGVRIFLLNGVGEGKASITAVISQGILLHDIGEIQVTILSLGDPPVLVDWFHSCKKEQ